MIGLIKGGLCSKPLAVTDALRCLIRLFSTARNVSDYVGALVLKSFAEGRVVFADYGYDGGWFAMD